MKSDHGHSCMEDEGEDPLCHRSAQEGLTAMERRLYWLWTCLSDKELNRDASDYPEDHMETRTSFGD